VGIILKAVILAAGEGRRCRPLTQKRSKVMLPVGNRPFMEHVIKALSANDVKDIVVVVGYQKERIMDYFEDGLHYGVKIEYIIQDELLGTAHALKKAESIINEDFLVLNGDNLLEEGSIRDLIMADGENVILAALRRHAGDYGVLSLEENRVVRINEKPGMPSAGIINTGAYRFTPEIFEWLKKTPISERGSYELTAALSRMIEKQREIRAVITDRLWADAIYAWDLLNANSMAISLRPDEIKGEIEAGAVCRGHVEIGDGTIVRSGSYIIGPVSIGRNCDIGPNAVLLPSTSICDSCRVGSNTEVRNSIMMSGSRIGSGCIITDSILGASSLLGDQVVAEAGRSVVEVEEFCHKADFGAVVADNTVVGSRVLMHPGTIIGADSIIGSGAVIRGNIERASRVI
jgi:glucose-1-phosphate thymidylyltransferase